MNTDLYTV